ncbi:hypothetical protein FB45DRAFT_531543 [Roridomyces roridus]|uniref:Uncharacterized protein n=1 Tax=Roridomyces roridus TaxID=1738132 RepID=A0AAD7BTD9_9AGAR|nr:hypothetical protein FB45DRAFT_531543 [Roridomyces roridus]
MFLADATQMIIQLLSLAFYVQALQSLYEPGPKNGIDYLATYNSFVTVSHIILALNMLMGDTLFVYRCYVIWGRNKAVVVLPVMLVLCTAALAVAIQYSLDSVTATQVGFLSIAITNLVLTGLTGKRPLSLAEPLGLATLGNFDFANHDLIDLLSVAAIQFDFQFHSIPTQTS